MSRTTLHRKIEEGPQQIRGNIKQAMCFIEFIATTTDCWSARRRGFLRVNAHWVIPDSLKRCSVALDCRQIKGPHTFDVLGSALNDIHSEFGREKKIVRTTTDNWRKTNKIRTITVPPVRLKRMLAVMMMNRKRKVLMLTLLR